MTTRVHHGRTCKAFSCISFLDFIYQFAETKKDWKLKLWTMNQHTCMNNFVHIIWKFNSCAQFVYAVVTFFVVLVVDDHETTISTSKFVKCLRCVFTAPTFAVELKTKISKSSLGDFSGAARDLSTLVDNFHGTLDNLVNWEKNKQTKEKNKKNKVLLLVLRLATLEVDLMKEFNSRVTFPKIQQNIFSALFSL